jgi:ATP-dependent RNA helicase DDX54/DBP10
MHPLIVQKAGREEVDRQALLRSLSQFRPAETVFEVGSRGAKTKEAITMVKRRKGLTKVIAATKVSRADLESDMIKKQMGALNNLGRGDTVLDEDELADETEIEELFETGKKRKTEGMFA